MTFDFPNGITAHMGKNGMGGMCTACGKPFKAKETMTFGSDGQFPYRWIHKICYLSEKLTYALREPPTLLPILR